MFNDITSRYNMTDATLEILIMLLVAFLLGVLLGYLLGKRCCQKENESSHSDSFTTTSRRYDDTPAVTTSTSVQNLTSTPVRKETAPPAPTETKVQEVSSDKADNDTSSSDGTVNDDWKPSVLSAPLGEPDDLKRISGIGPVIEKTLNEFGFFHYQQIAELTKENIAWLDNYIAFPGRIERENWVDQAKNLLEGNDTDFAKRYDKKS
jgi:predicted flap endonuclease-1-like 5' DNA nuclease